MTEAELQAAVIELAQLLKWRVAHFRPAMTAQGWRTAVSADGAGFPDLVLVRDRVLFVELKSARGRQSEHQVAWAKSILTAGGNWRLWFPRHWTNGEIERVLRLDDRVSDLHQPLRGKDFQG